MNTGHEHDILESEYESDYSSESEAESETESNGCSSQSEIKFSDVFYWLLLLLLTWQISHCISATAIDELLQYITQAFSVMGVLSPSVLIGLSAFPSSLYLAYKYLKIDRDAFSKYVICPKCYSMYNYEQNVEIWANSSKKMQLCQVSITSSTE